MALLYKRWAEPRSLFGDLMVVAFLVMQCLDGVFTYLGVGIWGPTIEANPLISSAMAVGGVVSGVAAAKLVGISFGIVLPLRPVHHPVAPLSLIFPPPATLPRPSPLLRPDPPMPSS